MTASKDCPLCGGTNSERVTFDLAFFPTRSSNPGFHSYENYACNDCGVVFMHPQPDDKALIAYYNSGYRRSSYALHLDGRWIDTPVNLEASVQSFQRFKNFFDIVTLAARKYPDAIPSHGDTIVDYGGYQGAFLSAAAQAWGANGIVVDYNRAGVEFAKTTFGFTESFVPTDMTTDTLPVSPRFATAVHSLEHLKNPRKFLAHLRENVLTPNGYLYVEVPNASGSSLSNPTHFFMYGADSLSYLLNSSGFEVVELRFTGFPREHLLEGNPIENIVCLARPADGVKAALRSATDRRISEIRRDYGRLSVRALTTTGRIAIQSWWVLLVKLLAVAVFDRFPGGVSRRLRSALTGLPRLLRGRSAS